MREFIVRDRWKGLLIEPLPDVFEELKVNYRYLKNPDLTFINSAISDRDDDALTFWTFQEEFLSLLKTEERMSYLRKASFSRRQVVSHLPPVHSPESALKAIKVQCYSLQTLVAKFWPHDRLDLIVVDAEGHDAKILRAINYEALRPHAVFFESQSLGGDEEEIFNLLKSHDYQVRRFGRDSVAQKADEANVTD